MPSAPRRGKYIVYAEIPEGLGAALEERVTADRRTRTAVVQMALEQYLGVDSSGQKPRKREKQ